MHASMGCPFAHRDPIQYALQKCPFLHAVAQQQGEAFAQNIASRPGRPALGAPAPVFEESFGDVQATFELFHGSSGVVPLVKRPQLQQQGTSPLASVSGRHPQATSSQRAKAARPTPSCGSPSYTSQTAPMAVISLSFLNLLPGYRDFFGKKKLRRQKRQQHASESEPQQLQGKPAASSDFGCPLRHLPVLGGLLPLSARGQLACPPFVLAIRAAVARLPPVQQLRPQALELRLFAIGLVAVLLNIPCGAIREHTRKFSAEWFLAVHITIPLIAPLRKAVLMPRWAIALSIAAAIAGQAAGSRLERKRIAAAAQGRPWPIQQALQQQLEQPRQASGAFASASSLMHDSTVAARSFVHRCQMPLACGFMGPAPVTAA